MNTVTKIKQAGVRKVHIVCIEHPEWGNWGVSEDNGEWLEIIGRSGSRVLHYAEANEHWRVA